MIRLLDVILAALGLVVGSPVFAILWLLGWLDTRSPLFVQERVGRGQVTFLLVKFRTMQLNTKSQATHLVDPASVTNFGHLLRRTKLDELPQLWNVLRGDMSLVGPRPCLPIQYELIKERAARGVFAVRPGITGRAQIEGVDMSRPRLLAELDAKMISELNLTKYLYFVTVTVFGVGGGDRVRRD